MQDTKISADNIRNEIKKAGGSWREYLVVKEPPEVPPLIQYDSVAVCTPFNHSLVIGKKKSRKSLYITYLLSQYAGTMEDILVCDTEQGKRHVWRGRDRIYKLTGSYPYTLSLRGLAPQQRRNVIKAAIEDVQPKIVVIDGIRDLLSDINDPNQATDLITWIESITITGPHILNVLHQNKNDNNARGHLGSELVNKAELITVIELDAKSGASLVTCGNSRDIPFTEFAFTHGADGLPVVVSSIPSRGNVLSDADQKTRLQYVFDGGLLSYGEVISGIQAHFSVGANKAKALLAAFIRYGWVVKNGKERTPDTRYKLMIEPKPPMV